jgi:hypothetical protein
MHRIMIPLCAGVRLLWDGFLDVWLMTRTMVLLAAIMSVTVPAAVIAGPLANWGPAVLTALGIPGPVTASAALASGLSAAFLSLAFCRVPRRWPPPVGEVLRRLFGGLCFVAAVLGALLPLFLAVWRLLSLADASTAEAHLSWGVLPVVLASFVAGALLAHRRQVARRRAVEEGG